MQIIKIKNPKDIFVVEYSFDQKCYHINSLEKSITQNLGAHLDGRGTSYELLGIAESYDEALALSCEIESKAKEAKYV